MIRAVLLDIEGTTSSLDYVREVLFPYSRSRIGEWLARPEGARIADDVRALAGRPGAGAGEVGRILTGWIDDDVKAAPLKTLQGLIWAEGFEAGVLVAHVYDDVPGMLRSWTRRGLRVYVYSSGSVLAQCAWFGNTRHGDLLPYISGHFDIPGAGPKQHPESYRTIAASLDVPATEIVFLSDLSAELDAARLAGLHAVAVSRPPLPPPSREDHLAVTTFTQLDLTGHRPRITPAAG